MTIHQFATTAEAYDACQFDDDIKNGDILLCIPERVIGVACTWPFAVTPARGSLHSIDGDATVAGLAASTRVPVESIEAARRLADELAAAFAATTRPELDAIRRDMDGLAALGDDTDPEGDPTAFDDALAAIVADVIEAA